MRVIAALGLAVLLLPSATWARGHGGGGGHRSSGGHATHQAVRSYTRRNGTFVESHHRSAADGSRTNNWSTRGNVNPDTGKAGTKSP